MLKNVLLIFFILLFQSCGELQQVVNQLPQEEQSVGNLEIGNALREALQKGIDKQVGKLTQTDGFLKNELVKIVLPEELQKVDKTLRQIGLANLADEGVKVLNRAAEDAVSEATPIFIDAVKEITFNDAKNILMGSENAATQYLENGTRNTLYEKFKPVIETSFNKVGANEIWTNLINRYNTIPLTKNVNPDLSDYVTQEALKGVFTMIAIEEREIRTSVASRTTTLLQKVFRMQD